MKYFLLSAADKQKLRLIIMSEYLQPEYKYNGPLAEALDIMDGISAVSFSNVDNSIDIELVEPETMSEPYQVLDLYL